MVIRREEGARAEQKPEQNASSNKHVGQGTTNRVGRDHAEICELIRLSSDVGVISSSPLARFSPEPAKNIARNILRSRLA